MSNVSILPRQLHVHCGEYVHIRATINISKLCKHQKLYLIYSEQTIHWGIIHFKVTHRFKNYMNITFIDAKYNLCDLCSLFFKKHCPLQSGTYYCNYREITPSLFWTVSANLNHYCIYMAAPQGKYKIEVTIYNENGEQMFCVLKEMEII